MRSFSLKTGGADLWRPQSASRPPLDEVAARTEAYWALQFPKFEDAPSKEAAILAYWQLYANESAALVRRWPRRTAVFSSPECFQPGEARRMLRFAGFAKPRVEGREMERHHNCLLTCE